MTYFCYGCGYELNGLPKCPECGLKQTEMGRIGAALGRHRRSLHLRIAIILACWIIAWVPWHPDLPLPWSVRMMVGLTSVALGYAAVTWITHARLRSEGARHAFVKSAGVALVLMALGGLALGEVAVALRGY